MKRLDLVLAQVLLLVTAPAMPGVFDHPYPDVYFHYDINLGRDLLELSHETKWTDLVAATVCRNLDTNGDGRTSKEEARVFIDQWVAQVRRDFRVVLDGVPLVLPPPAFSEETLTEFAEKGNQALAVPEWTISLCFDLPLMADHEKGELTLQEEAYRGENGIDEYWATNGVGVVGEEGLRILFVTVPEDPKYITRKYEVRWDWQGEGIAEYSSPTVEDPNAKDRERMGGLLNDIGKNPWFLPLALLLAAFYGMGHALAPGHGKAMVAGYLVGSKGSVRDAVMLGLVVTFTHTFMVFLFALIWYFFRDQFQTKVVEAWLGVASGALIALLGIWLFWRRNPWSALARKIGKPDKPHHHHHHHHGHNHGHHQEKTKHTRLGAMGHWFSHLRGEDHQHLPTDPDRVSPGQLLWLGISGGIVPCPAALIALLFSFQTDRPGAGLAIVVAFSVGLAGVLVGIGILMVTSRNFLERISGGTENLSSVLRWLPAFSATCVTLVGSLITYNSWPRF